MTRFVLSYCYDMSVFVSVTCDCDVEDIYAGEADVCS